MTLALFVAAGWLLQSVSWLASLARYRSQAAVRGEWMRELTLRAMMVVLAVWSLMEPPFAWFSAAPPAAAQFLALCVFAMGQTMAVVGRHTLASGWSIGIQARSARRVTGIYRYVSHPIYTGITLALLGQTVLLRNLPSFLLLAGAVAVTPVKAALESRAWRRVERHHHG